MGLRSACVHRKDQSECKEHSSAWLSWSFHILAFVLGDMFGLRSGVSPPASWAQGRGKLLWVCTSSATAKYPPPPKCTSGALLSPQIRPNFAVPTYLHAQARDRSARKCDESGKKRLASGARACGAKPERAAAPPRNQHRKVRPCNIHGSGVASRKRRPPRAHTRVISSFSHFGCAMRRRGGRAAANLAPSTERKP